MLARPPLQRRAARLASLLASRSGVVQAAERVPSARATTPNPLL